MAAIVRFPPGARVRPGDLGGGVAKATYRFQVSPLPLPSQAQAEECADAPELRMVWGNTPTLAFGCLLSCWGG